MLDVQHISWDGWGVDDGIEALLNVDSHFAINLRTLRERVGMSQADLADALKKRGFPNIHPTTVARIESGTREARIGEGVAIADILGSSLAVLASPPAELKSNVALLTASQRLHDSAQALEAASVAMAMDAERFVKEMEAGARGLASSSRDDLPGVQALTMRLAQEHVDRVEGHLWRSVAVSHGLKALESPMDLSGDIGSRKLRAHYGNNASTQPDADTDGQ